MPKAKSNCYSYEKVAFNVKPGSSLKQFLAASLDNALSSKLPASSEALKTSARTTAYLISTASMHNIKYARVCLNCIHSMSKCDLIAYSDWFIRMKNSIIRKRCLGNRRNVWNSRSPKQSWNPRKIRRWWQSRSKTNNFQHNTLTNQQCSGVVRSGPLRSKISLLDPLKPLTSESALKNLRVRIPGSNPTRTFASIYPSGLR